MFHELVNIHYKYKHELVVNEVTSDIISVSFWFKTLTETIMICVKR